MNNGPCGLKKLNHLAHCSQLLTVLCQGDLFIPDRGRSRIAFERVTLTKPKKVTFAEAPGLGDEN